MSNISSGAARALAWTMAVAVTGVAAYVGCKTIGGNTGDNGSPQPPPNAEIVDDLRVLWTFERNYAFRNKRLATSINEMGDGTGIGKNGFVTKPSIWAARLDENDSPRPASYWLKVSPSAEKRNVGAYRFGISPVAAEDGKLERFAVVLFSVPQSASDSDVCFIALCGPVNLKNDFSFDYAWPVFQVKATPAVVKSLIAMQPTSLASLKLRLEEGDLKPFVLRTFEGFEYPRDTP